MTDSLCRKRKLADLFIPFESANTVIKVPSTSHNKILHSIIPMGHFNDNVFVSLFYNFELLWHDIAAMRINKKQN